jgi:hypothetical protein
VGWNLAEQAFKTSWATNPPRTAFIGDKSPDAWKASSLTIFSSISLFISLASDKTAAASSSFLGLGNLPVRDLNSDSAWKATCRAAGRSNLAKSVMKKSRLPRDSRSDF